MDVRADMDPGLYSARLSPQSANMPHSVASNMMQPRRDTEILPSKPTPNPVPASKTKLSEHLAPQ